MTAREFFSFPDPVNEVAVRVTATGVALLALSAVAFQWPEPLIALAYGFCARAAAGPRLSPLARLSVHVVAPRLAPPRPVPGRPKRFAQALGAVVSVTATVLYFALSWHGPALALAALMAILATLEAGFRLCVGCVIYARLVDRGLVSGAVCVECNDVRLLARTR